MAIRNVVVRMDKNALVVTKTFFKKAQVFNSPEFKELRAAMEMFPAFTVKSPAQVSGKRTYKNLTVEQMCGYIATQPDSEARLAEFDAVLTVADAKGAKYPAAKKWFFEKYPEFKKRCVSQHETDELLGKVVPMPTPEPAASNF